MSQLLTLPEQSTLPAADDAAVRAAWTEYLGSEQPLLLISTPDRARQLLMQAAGIANGEPVGLPANCRRRHSESVKRAGGTPRFVDLLPDLEFEPETVGFQDLRVLWAAPAAGMPAPASQSRTLFVDYTDTFPGPEAGRVVTDAAATMWSLHLSTGKSDVNEGALVAFEDAALHVAVKELMTPDDVPDAGHALAQLQRLAGESGLAARQLRVYKEVHEGMEAGAGLPMPDFSRSKSLPGGLLVRVPDEADIATFISYVRNENVIIDWLPELQPMFYVGYQVTKDRDRTFQSASHLARWVSSPLGPDFTDDEIVHAVLGILKAAEYTGVRWRTDPDRAAWYGNLMLEWYGPSHDAYRPAFLEQSESSEYLAKVVAPGR